MSKLLRRLLPLLILFAIAGCSARRTNAQFIGYTSPQTVNQSVFSAASCSGGTLKSATMPNVGQSVHVVTYNLAFSGSGPVLRIMASFNGSTWAQISDDGMGAQANASNFTILPAYGSYPFVQIWVLNGSVGCTVTASYFGTSVSPPNNTGGADVGTYAKNILAGPSNASLATTELLPPYGSTSGFLVFEYQGANGPSGSTILVTVRESTGDTSTIASFKPDFLAGALQFFSVPAVTASDMNISYQTGGASAGSFSAVYFSLKPGASQAPLCEKTAVINTAAAGPTQAIAGLSGQQVRICSINIGSSTAEGIDFQQGQNATCASVNSQLTGVTHLAANTPWIQGFLGGGLVTLPSAFVCVHLSGANQTDGTITYSQY